MLFICQTNNVLEGYLSSMHYKQLNKNMKQILFLTLNTAKETGNF